MIAESVPLNLDSPKLQAFCIGLPKTGTTSIARIFKQYRSAHEFQFASTVNKIIEWKNNQISEQEFQRFIIKRVQENRFGMDSASFSHYYFDILLKEFPKAKFIILVRDFESWLNSYLSMLYFRLSKVMQAKEKIPDWWQDYGRLQFGQFEIKDFTSLENIKNKLSEICKSFFDFWNESYRMIYNIMDNDRSLVVRTVKISDNIEIIANFFNISVNSLQRNESRANQNLSPVRFTDFIESDLLERFREQFWFPETYKLYYF